LKALSVFEYAQFLSDIDPHVGIRSNRDSPVRFEKIRSRKQTVTEIGLCHRAKPNHGFRRRNALRFDLSHVGCMYEAPVFIHLERVE
jgi:hypothetical protein